MLENINFQPVDFNDTSTEDNMLLLYKAIAYLSDVEKSIVLLYLEDKPYDEIAEITGLTRSNVAVKLMRIKNKLKELSNE